VELILARQPDGLGCDGVYWDEFEYSRLPVRVSPWQRTGRDGPALGWRECRHRSPDAENRAAQEFGGIALAALPPGAGPRTFWPVVRWLANGQPHTRTMLQSISRGSSRRGVSAVASRAQAYSPIALGDHLTERSELDAYRSGCCGALDFGCLYYWYNDLTVVPHHRRT